MTLLKTLPTDLENIIMDYKNQMEHRTKYKKCLTLINNIDKKYAIDGLGLFYLQIDLNKDKKNINELDEDEEDEYCNNLIFVEDIKDNKITDILTEKERQYNYRQMEINNKNIYFNKDMDLIVKHKQPLKERFLYQLNCVNHSQTILRIRNNKVKASVRRIGDILIYYYLLNGKLETIRQTL